MNEIMNVFNYGQREYEFVMKITDKMYKKNNKYNYEYKRKANTSSAKYEIVMNIHSKLLSLFDLYGDDFPRFVKGFTRTIKSPQYTSHFKGKDENGDDIYDIKGFSYKIQGYNISKSFLSYIIQNKNNIMHIFDYKTTKTKKSFSILKANKVFRCDKNNILIDGYYTDVIVFNETDERIEKYNIDIIKGCAYINDKKYNVVMFKNGVDWLTVDSYYTNNNYELFKTLLKKYFESVNICNDNDFDKYLDTEVQKLMVVDYDKELKRLQNFGKISLEKR